MNKERFVEELKQIIQKNRKNAGADQKLAILLAKIDQMDGQRGVVDKRLRLLEGVSRVTSGVVLGSVGKAEIPNGVTSRQDWETYWHTKRLTARNRHEGQKLADAVSEKMNGDYARCIERVDRGEIKQNSTYGRIVPFGIALVEVTRVTTYARSSRWMPSKARGRFLVLLDENGGWTLANVSKHAENVCEAIKWRWGVVPEKIVCLYDRRLALVQGKGPKGLEHLPDDVSRIPGKGERVIVGRVAQAF